SGKPNSLSCSRRATLSQSSHRPGLEAQSTTAMEGKKAVRQRERHSTLPSVPAVPSWPTQVIILVIAAPSRCPPFRPWHIRLPYSRYASKIPYVTEENADLVSARPTNGRRWGPAIAIIDGPDVFADAGGG